MPDASVTDLARTVHEALRGRGETLALAESLTGGLLGATVTAVPGVSATFRGGLTAYATDTKATLLGVDPALLARVGPVDPEVAAQMAEGARVRFSATYGLATTGVAGPDAQAGHPPGEVHLAMAGPGGVERERLHLEGDRDAVREQAVHAALLLAHRVVDREAAR